MNGNSQDALNESFEGALGLEVDSSDAEQARARVKVANNVLQPMGLVHGGVYATVAETLAAQAIDRELATGEVRAVALSSQTSFLRPITAGTIHAHARRRHRGRTTWLWEVDFSDDAGRLCATTRMTMAVRAPDPA